MYTILCVYIYIYVYTYIYIYIYTQIYTHRGLECDFDLHSFEIETLGNVRRRRSARPAALKQ